MTNKQ